jgi:hypothetical protein
VSAALGRAESHDSEQSSTPDSVSSSVKDSIGSSVLDRELRSYTIRMQHLATAEALGLGATNCAGLDIRFLLGLEDLKLDAGRFASWPNYVVPERTPAIGLLA